MKRLLIASALVLCVAFAGLADAKRPHAQQSVNQPMTITVTVTPALAGIDTSNKTVNTVGPVNHGTVVGAVVVTTNPPGGSTANVTLSKTGTDAAKFALTSTTLPSNLVVGATDLAAASYNLTLTGSTP